MSTPEPSAAVTRRRLVEAASEAFAEDGVFTASLVEITRRAGQRNRGAVHYHFGNREGLLVEVLEEHSAFLAEREGDLLAQAQATADDDLAPVILALVRPAVELAETGESGRRYLVIVGQLVEEFDRLTAPVVEALGHTGGYAVYALLEERLPPYDDALRLERFALVTGFILRTVSDRARTRARPRSGRPELPKDRFIANLVSMAVGMALAPTDRNAPRGD